MVKESIKLNVQDYSGEGNDLEILVNWNEAVKPAKYIKFSVGGNECVVKKEHFLHLAFTLANEREQDKLIIADVTEVFNRDTMITIKASKLIQKGESINIPVTISRNSKGEVTLK